ncbi:MAG: cytochrome c oxidase assembly protein [Pseudomonadota bacterium]
MIAVPLVLKDRNRRVGTYAALGALAMLGLGYASVPLYRLFCQVTGFNGTTQRATAAEADAVKVLPIAITVRFDANVDRTLPWEFKPLQITQRVQIGARSLAAYSARNLSGQPITGRASFNVEPEEAGKYFKKIQCFCFTQQTLQPGQQVNMPVTYFVDPEIMQDDDAKQVEQITLSYTFHEDRSASIAKADAKPLDRPANPG